MKKTLTAMVLALALMSAARAQSDTTAVSDVSALPLASVAASAGTAAGASVAVPAILSTAGAVFVIKAVQAGALSTTYMLERASDGARVSVEVASQQAKNASAVVGNLVTVSVVNAGVILSIAGEAIAFLPNALGRTLLHTERLTP